MGWERGYYYRVFKVNGRVMREYLGRGRVAVLAARLDAQEREKRQLQAHDLLRQKDELETLDADLKALEQTTDLLARAALLAAGFHQHKRGEWRKQRERDGKPGSGRSEEA
jgi:hypothetical protein